jgi:hypothetical protein
MVVLKLGVNIINYRTKTILFSNVKRPNQQRCQRRKQNVTKLIIYILINKKHSNLLKYHNNSKNLPLTIKILLKTLIF